MAQLGARFHGMEEVEGSNPSRSTNISKGFLPARSTRAVKSPLPVDIRPHLNPAPGGFPANARTLRPGDGGS